MSDFTGSNKYTITPRHTDKKLDLYQGSKNDGTTLQIYESQPGNPNQEFVFADVGNDEYLILNLGTGTYMTANSETDAPVSGNLLPPVDQRVRWKVVPVRGGSGAYNLYSVAYPDLVMDIFRAGTDNETPVVLWTNNGEQNQQFYLRLP